jgi:hypothetical protein
MIQFDYVEDYIEVIAGLRDIPNTSQDFLLGGPVSLARYDQKVVPSLAQQTHWHNRGYTDRQAELATQLVLKYERQLTKLGVDVSPVREPQYRYPLRTIDRSTRVWIEDDKIKMRFPFNTAMVESVREATKESQGKFFFNRDQRYYEADITEWNLTWINTFAQSHQFTVDTSVTELLDLVNTVEQQSYAIQLIYSDSGLAIDNASDHLTAYVNTHLGGFTLENIFTLVDHAPLLGYTISQSIEQDIIKQFGTRFHSLCANRVLKTAPGASLVREIMNYAVATNRLPVHVYEPDLSDRLRQAFAQCVAPNEMSSPADKTDQTKVVFFNTIEKQQNFDHVPLLISSAGMMIGGERMMFIQNAKKIVYFSHDVYNKARVKGQDICKLN